MISKACVKFIRISPRKVRYVIDLIRSKKVREAQSILSGSPRRAGEIMRKLLDQAVDAAVKNSQIEADNLVISKVTADGGPTMKRFRAASMGRASVIRKRTSHIFLELDVVKNYVAKGAAPKAKAAGQQQKSATKRGGSAVRRKLVGAK